MRHIKPYKVFESGNAKPVKKFPTEKAIHFNAIVELLKERGLDPYNLSGGSRGEGIQHFFFEKCSQKNVVFPNNKEQDIRKGGIGTDYKNFIFGESVFLIPIEYDSKNDMANYITKKLSFMQKMRDNLDKLYPNRTKAEKEKADSDLEKYVHFGPEGYDWANPALKIIHDEYSQYYKDGKLRVWFPQDRDCDPWDGYDYPHRYDVVGDLDRPDGVYYLSDIERYIWSKYGIQDDDFYKYIIDNCYIEGRYWERVWSLQIDEKNPGKFERKGGEYGMDATENINHILNIIEKEFADEIKGTQYEGFTIYIDYYKKMENL